MTREWEGLSLKDSAVCQQEIFEYFLKKNKIEVAVEIGTMNGAGAKLLSKYANRVYTLDIVSKEHLISILPKNVTIIQIKDNLEKKVFLESMNFDFAFVDGDHTELGVLLDFECVKKCGRVLFHDYRVGDNTKWSGPREAIRELGIKVEVREPFAYWEISNGAVQEKQYRGWIK